MMRNLTHLIMLVSWKKKCDSRDPMWSAYHFNYENVNMDNLLFINPFDTKEENGSVLLCRLQTTGVEYSDFRRGWDRNQVNFKPFL